MERLIDTAGVDDYELWLLRSAAAERPTAAAVAAMRAGLGISKIAAAAQVTSVSSLKLTLVAVSVGAFLGLHGTEPSLSPVAKSATSNESVVVAAPVFSEFREPESRPEPVVEPATLPKSPKARERSAATERNRPNSGPDLREEIRLLDAARNAVRAQQPELALESLNAYSARFPSGAFRQEAAVLRIQAVALRGESGRASAMAKQFVQSNPNSPYVGKASRIAKGPSNGTVPIPK